MTLIVRTAKKGPECLETPNDGVWPRQPRLNVAGMLYVKDRQSTGHLKPSIRSEVLGL